MAVKDEDELVVGGGMGLPTGANTKGVGGVATVDGDGVPWGVVEVAGETLMANF